MEEYLSRKEIIVRNWKKGKLKIKTLTKITLLDEQEPSVQSTGRTKAVQVWSRGNLFSKPGNWKTFMSEHKYWNTGYHAKENSSEETISENSKIRELHETMKLLNE